VTPCESELVAAVEPVVDRPHRTYKAAQEALTVATEKNDKEAAKAAQDQLDALRLFQRDVAAFQRLYTYLSQIFDYGNTAVEKRAIFFGQVIREGLRDVLLGPARLRVHHCPSW
jgi:type I restriction enzyme R subunit